MFDLNEGFVSTGHVIVRFLAKNVIRCLMLDIVSITAGKKMHSSRQCLILVTQEALCVRPAHTHGSLGSHGVRSALPSWKVTGYQGPFGVEGTSKLSVEYFLCPNSVGARTVGVQKRATFLGSHLEMGDRWTPLYSGELCIISPWLAGEAWPWELC